MSFEYLLFLDGLFVQLLNNFFDNCLLDFPAFDIGIEILIGVPVRIRGALLRFRFLAVVEAFDVLLGVEDDHLVEAFMVVLLGSVDAVIEESRESLDDLGDVMGDGLDGLEGIEDEPHRLPHLRRLLGVLLLVEGFALLAVVGLVLVEVLVAHKYFIVLHGYNDREVGSCSSLVVEVAVLLLLALPWTLAATQGSTVVYVRHLVVHLTAVVALPLPQALRVHQLLVLQEHVGAAVRAGGVGGVAMLGLGAGSGVGLGVGQAFRCTALLPRFAGQFGIEVGSELRVEHDNLSNGVLVSVQLVLQKLAVLGVDAGLELVGLDAAVEAELEVAEEVGHLADVGPVLHVDEVVFALLVADGALIDFAVALGEAFLAEDAVAVEDEAARALEAEVALVAVHLELFLHIYYYPGRGQSTPMHIWDKLWIAV